MFTQVWIFNHVVLVIRKHIWKQYTELKIMLIKNKISITINLLKFTQQLEWPKGLPSQHKSTQVFNLHTSQFHNHAQYLKVKYSGRPLDSQTWQTEWKTAPLAKVQLCEYENQTLEAFVAASRLYAIYSLIVLWPARNFHF